MNFQGLHERLRLELLRRIEIGELTGTKLARLSDFQQGHVSNFLNGRRALSLEGLDRVLASQGLTVEQILRPEISLSAGSEMPAHPESPDIATLEPIESIPVVSSSVAADEAQISDSSVIETLPVAVSRLTGHRVRPSTRQADWQRFVAIRPDSQQVTAMGHVISPGSIAVIDRHYNSLAPHLSNQPTVYAVRYGAGLLLRYVEFEDRRLILRPSSVEFPVVLVTIGADEMPSDYIVGRVCLLFREL